MNHRETELGSVDTGLCGGDSIEIGKVRALLTGRARPYTRPGSLSGIDKQVRNGAVVVSALGFEGDEQGDLRVHGGVDKAVHCYAWAQYEPWREELADNALAMALLAQPGAFGENLSVDGMDEHDICFADQWQIGTARFEISQGRQPCWKLNDRFHVPDMALRVQTGLRTGWYLRVLQEGSVQAGDVIRRIARPHPEWTIAALLRVIAEGNCTPQTMDAILALPLPPSWRKLFTRRKESGNVEAWGPRLDGSS